jgi:hypothetical protein
MKLTVGFNTNNYILGVKMSLEDEGIFSDLKNFIQEITSLSLVLCYSANFTDLYVHLLPPDDGDSKRI